MFKTLSDTERNVFKTVAWTGGDFAVVARVMGLRSEAEAEAIYERARAIVVKEIHGEPDKEWKSIQAIADSLDVDPTWVTRRIGPHRATGLNCVVESQAAIRYPPKVVLSLQSLRQEQLGVPPAGGYLSLAAVCRLAGTREKRAKRILSSAGIVAEPRRDGNARVYLCYPPVSVEILKDFSLPPADDWLTPSGIGQQLGVTKEWVVARLPSIEHAGEVRAARFNAKPLRHYPPGVVDQLRDQAPDPDVPPAAGWLTAQEIERLGQLPYLWVRERVQYGYHPSEQRRDSRNVVRTHYPPGLVDLLVREYYQ